MKTYIDNGDTITLHSVSIPKDGGNRHYQEFLELQAAGEAELTAPIVLLADAKEAACARLNAKRDAIQYGTFTDSHGHPYDVDSKGREKMTGLEAKIANGLVLPEGFTWTGADNVERPHTNATFLALTTEILIWTSTVHGVCVVAKAAIRDDSVTTAEQVAAIEAGVVWP